MRTCKMFSDDKRLVLYIDDKYTGTRYFPISEIIKLIIRYTVHYYIYRFNFMYVWYIDRIFQ